MSRCGGKGGLSSQRKRERNDSNGLSLFPLLLDLVIHVAFVLFLDT